MTDPRNPPGTSLGGSGGSLGGQNKWHTLALFGGSNLNPPEQVVEAVRGSNLNPPEQGDAAVLGPSS